MKAILKAFSYVFHPLWLPLFTVLYYFYITPRFLSGSFIYSKVFAIGILTVIIPILSFFMLKNLNLVATVHLKTPKERIYPLLLQVAFTTLIIFKIFKGYELPELHYFFLGALGTTVSCLFLALFKIKASLHMASLGGVLLFIIGLSLHFQISLLLYIAIAVFIVGATASSRLLAKAHTVPELVIGFILGSVPQFLTYSQWI